MTQNLFEVRDVFGKWQPINGMQAAAYRLEGATVRIAEVKADQCGRVFSGVACPSPKGSKCPDCGPACHEVGEGD